ELLERPCERLIVDPANEPVARAHLVCAAAELGLSPARDGAYFERHRHLLDGLVAEGKLKRLAKSEEVVSTQRKPQKNVSLRGSGQSYEVIDGNSGEVIGTLDGIRALFEGHPGAVYLHGGRQYLVDTLDPENHHVVAREGELEYFTSPLTEKETEILEILAERREGPLSAYLVKVEVTERVVGFERKRVQTQETLGQHPLELPPSSYQTVAVLFRAPKAFEDQLVEAREHFMGALHASEHAAISLLPLLALCDRGDIGGISYPFHPQLGCGGVFIYDGHPGGVGIAARAFNELPELLTRVGALLTSCPCESGCPSCVQSPKCGNGNRPLDKAGAARIVRLILGEEPASFELEFPEIDLTAGPKVVPAPRTSPSGLLSPSPSNPLPGQEEQEGGERGGDVGVRSADVREFVRAPQPRRPAARGGSPSLRPTIVFDLETRRSADEVGGWEHLHRLGVAVGVACVLEEGRFEIYREDRVGELVDLLASAGLVVGFNVKRFDYAVLSGYTGVDHGRFWPTLDLLEDLERRLGHRLSLNQVAGATLGVAKSGDGLESLEWVRQGRLAEVEAYCRKDVEITRDLYLFGRREGFVRCPGEAGAVLDVAVSW
ncbi:MAG: Zn-binding domain-containing protein, partial [Thermoanaerobaculia bacterium]|nr:Zn-binding domain-containing protein [Thermoanaerobaculia bacterium]